MNKINLEFLPDVIVFFCNSTNDGIGRHEVWGDKVFYESIQKYVYSNMVEGISSGWVFIQKSTLNFKVVPGNLDDD